MRTEPGARSVHAGDCRSAGPRSFRAGISCGSVRFGAELTTSRILRSGVGTLIVASADCAPRNARRCRSAAPAAAELGDRAAPRRSAARRRARDLSEEVLRGAGARAPRRRYGRWPRRRDDEESCRARPSVNDTRGRPVRSARRTPPQASLSHMREYTRKSGAAPGWHHSFPQWSPCVSPTIALSLRVRAVPSPSSRRSYR